MIDELVSRLVTTERNVPAPPVGYTHASTLNAFEFSADANGACTYWLDPLNPTAVFESPVNAPANPNVGEPTYEPGRLLPLESVAVVPDASPNRQYAAGLSASTALAYALDVEEETVMVSGELVDDRFVTVSVTINFTV